MASAGGKEKRTAILEIDQTDKPTKKLKHVFYNCDETVGHMVEELLLDELDVPMDQLTKQFELSVQLLDEKEGFVDMSKKRWKNETIENDGHYKVLLRQPMTAPQTADRETSSNVPQQVNLLELSRLLESKGILYIDRDNRQLLNDDAFTNQQKECFVLLYSQSTSADEETIYKFNICLEYLFELFDRGKKTIFVNLGQLLGDQNDELPEAIRAIDGFPHIGVRIVKMNGAQLLTADYVLEEMKKLGVCTARIENSQLTDGTAPATGQTLLNCALPCPISKAHGGKCPNRDFLWGCDNCGKTLTFVKRENAQITHLFCGCGRTPVEQFSFRCANVEEHGNIFCHFASKTVLNKELLRLGKKKDVNILLVGETGMGKSTMINALLNYLKYPTMKEALEADDVDWMIPARFNKSEFNAEGELVNKSLFLGEPNDKERLDPTKSSTKCATLYVIPTKEGNKICCIDSAGVGDTGGPTGDTSNYANLMDYITELDKLHGICIFLKPEANRATVSFEYCFNTILTYMHKSAIQNIVFLFTHSSGSGFSVANVVPLLEKVLKPIEKKYGVKLLHRDRIYCVDNEAFEKLGRIKKFGEQYEEEEMDKFAKSWARSEEASHRLLDYLSGLSPHLTRESASLSNARRIINDLAQPMASITSRIQTNLVDMNMLHSAIGKDEKKKDEQLKYYSVENVPLDYPRTVCTEPKCTEVKSVNDGINTVVFTQICHSHCGLDGVQENAHPNPTLKHCWAMNSDNECEACGCSWEVHMHIRCEQRVTKCSVDPSLLEELAQNRGSLTDKQLVQRQMEEERDKIYEKAAIFSAFLSSSALKASNDSTEAYIEVSIKGAEQLMAQSKGTSDFEKYRLNLEALRDSLRLYKEMKKRIDQKKGVSGQISLDDVKKHVAELCALKIFGKDIKQMYDVHQQTQQREHKRFKEEKVYGGKNQKAEPSRTRNASNQETVTGFWQKVKRVGGSWFGSAQQSNAQTSDDRCYVPNSSADEQRALDDRDLPAGRLSTTEKDQLGCSTTTTTIVKSSRF